jgi:hypothetical protein
VLDGRAGCARDRNVYTGGLATRQGAVHRWPDFLGPRDVLAMRAERLRHKVVALQQQVRRNQAVGAVHLDLSMPLRAPASVVADDGDDRDAVPHRGIELQTMEAKRSIAHAGNGAPARTRDSSAHGQGETGADAAELPVRQERGRAVGQPPSRPLTKLAAIHGHTVVRPDAFAQLGDHAQRVNGRFLGCSEVRQRVAIRRAPAGKAARPRRVVPGATAGGLQQLTHNSGEITDQSSGDGAVAGDLRSVRVNLDQLRMRRERRRTAVCDGEVLRTEQEHDVRLGDSGAEAVQQRVHQAAGGINW